jgi:hypothetical protein
MQIHEVPWFSGCLLSGHQSDSIGNRKMVLRDCKEIEFPYCYDYPIWVFSIFHW